MFVLIIEITALLLVAVTMALSLAHVLELPGKARLPREHYIAVQRIYYPGFTYAGVCEPLAIIALLGLLVLLESGSTAFWLTAGALLAAALTHALYWLLTAPVNKFWMRDEKLSESARRFFAAGSTRDPEDNWEVYRRRWEHSHVYRALTATTAFVLLAIAIAI